MFSLVTCSAMAGIAEWVCCPGALTPPLYRTLASCPVVHRWAVSDPRTAAYFALGRVQATARPVAVVAGSGTDAAAMLPAVEEAYYERRPLIVVTLAEHGDNGGSGAPHAAEAENLFGLFAPTHVLDLPCAVSDLPDFAGMMADGFPLHLHLRLNSEALRCQGDFSTTEVGEAPAPPAFRGSLVALSQMLRFRAVEGLVLVIGGLEPAEQEPVLWLAQTLRVPVLAEAASGLREELSPYLLHDASSILRSCPPRFVLRVGDVPNDPFWHALEDMPQTEVFSVTRTGFSGLNRKSTVIEGDPEQIMKALGDVPTIGDTERLLPRARHAAGRTEEEVLSSPESAPALVRAISNYAALADVICLGSPTVSALWNRCAQTQIATLYVRELAARSSAGVLAAFLGNAADAPSAFCLLGDIALLQDVTAPAQLLHELPEGKRIIAVLSNGGAACAREESAEDIEWERLMMQPPALSLADVAALWGAEYYSVRSESDLEVLDTVEDGATVLLELLPE